MTRGSSQGEGGQSRVVAYGQAGGG